ncbi:endo-1,4-beta-xylanase [Rhodococcus sp. NPDC058514]|uniref:endo-1,4-beta-xylanase n=1 Tax=unclassified Rhodococcus (in: high G+C Gram-positive bacteria) TaxID=192944 RepID=UPI00365B764F
MSEDATVFRRERIVAGETELLRPIIGVWCNDGVVGPDAFNLSSADKKDFNRLSIVRGDATTPEQAYMARAASIKARCDASGKPYTPPVGVLAVTVEEVESIEIKSPAGSESRWPLTVWDDSMNDDRPDDHGHVDFNDVPPSDKGACLLAAKTMLATARARGWKFSPAEHAE